MLSGDPEKVLIRLQINNATKIIYFIFEFIFYLRHVPIILQNKKKII